MRLLFITSNRLGDAVLSTSVLRHFVETYPDIRVTIACGPVAAPIFEAVPGLDRIIEMPKQKRGGHWWKLWKSVVGTWWDIIIDLRGSAIAYTLPGRKRIVLNGNDDSIHRVEQLGRLIGVMPPPLPKIWTRPQDDARAEEILKLHGRKLLVIGPAANWGGKIWPARSFSEAIVKLTDFDGLLPEAHVLLVGAPAERRIAESVIASVNENHRTVIFGDENLLTIQACLQRADLYVGNDSGLMHMAAAAAVPTLGLFGPSRPENYGPYGRKTAFVRTDMSYDEIWSGGANWRSSDSLMDGLPVDRVIKAAENLLAKTDMQK
ncbi:glycosyltransferase family 9 protein [Thalassospira sp.]|uniref:glycosyltransferase family 9 protein n=1 Tax=Thalassospira sp. TaxID=1912094 RepID=UPI0027338644|nr:glycosyltransferase family 9 protein [Thalassospira sp.]MDP2696764.1 glycosyltransferase family 9 protein [Thalassospira sp.]